MCLSVKRNTRKDRTPFQYSSGIEHRRCYDGLLRKEETKSQPYMAWKHRPDHLLHSAPQIRTKTKAPFREFRFGGSEKMGFIPPQGGTFLSSVRHDSLFNGYHTACRTASNSVHHNGNDAFTSHLMTADVSLSGRNVWSCAGFLHSGLVVTTVLADASSSICGFGIHSIF